MFDPDPQLDSLLQKLLHPELRVIDPSLDRIEKLLLALGNPQLALPPVIHVAGTNGKGSLIAILRSILKAAGYRVHAYTSPHLVHFNERIVLNHQPIETDVLTPFLERVLMLQDLYPATFFEATTAAAFLAFSQNPADIVLLETGMGGRLDSTNVIPRPAVTAITPIGMDHSEFLGDTLRQIALEKAGIMKHQRPCVIGPQVAEIAITLKECAAKNYATAFSHGDDWNYSMNTTTWYYQGAQYSGEYPFPSLQGGHQIANAATAIAVLEQLEDFTFTHQQIAEGLENTSWPARLETLATGYWHSFLPVGEWTITLDGGHNPHAAHVIANWLYGQPAPRHLVLGILKNKDLRGYLDPLRGLVSHIYATDIPYGYGCYTAEEIRAIAKEMGFFASAYATPEEAMQQIALRNEGTILIAGSLYLAGYILSKLTNY